MRPRATTDVARSVRLAAARRDGDLGVLRREVDHALRTRRFLDYWAKHGMGDRRDVRSWLSSRRRCGPSRRASSSSCCNARWRHVAKVILHADDSSGLIGDLVRDLLDLHARACDVGVAEPHKLAAWMIRFRFGDQDFFEIDPVRYAAALGDAGMVAYRSAVEQIDDADSYGVRYVRERLAVLDRDIEAIVRLHGGDLTNVFQFLHVAEAMVELGRDDLVLEWTSRGIAETDGCQISGFTTPPAKPTPALSNR